MKPKAKLYTRRSFIRTGVTLAAATATIPTFLSRTALAIGQPSEVPSTAVRPAVPDERVLVVVQLSGGNDGLNTVVPFRNDDYYRLRPTLAINRKAVLTIDDEVGFHPSLTAFKELYDNGLLGVIQGVGYPNADRSHFRSMEVWQTGIVSGYENSGWIGRLFDHTCGNGDAHGCSPTLGVSVGNALNPALLNESGIGVAVEDPEQLYRMTRLFQASQPEPSANGEHVSKLSFLRRTAMNAEVSAGRIVQSVRSVQSQTAYPDNRFAQGLKLIAGMIAGGLDARVYYISLTGFDTHANQENTHARLLKILSDGVAAFQRDVENLNQASRVLGMTFSEFGRRAAQNGSRGTDHGQAAPMFIFGEPVAAGLIGEYPNLETLADGDVGYSIDFRSVYATILEDWLHADAQAILGKRYEKIAVI